MAKSTTLSKPPPLLIITIIIFIFIKTSSSTQDHDLHDDHDLFPPEARPTKSGYLPVSQTTNSSMYYAFYEAQSPTKPLHQTPLIIWLQGGPGCSSMIANFFELGPWLVTRRNTSFSLRPNPASWNRLFGLLFLDNPVGTGFSIASSLSDIPTNQTQVARHLFAAILGFLHSAPGFPSRPVYITGESYAGKYVPAIAYHIMKENPGRVNLAGIAIGNGLTDPEVQVRTHADNAYFTGLVNGRQKVELEMVQDQAVRLVKVGKWREARAARVEVLNMLESMTGLATLYDYSKAEPYEDEMVAELLRDAKAKRAMGARTGVVFEICSDTVGEVMREDVMKSVKYMVEYLLKKSGPKVLLYQGFYDLRDGVVSTESWVRTMEWEGIGAFLAAERKVWKVDGELAGYVQRSGGLVNAVVLGAGHLVPADRGRSAQAMIEDWVLERGLFGGKGEEGNEKVKTVNKVFGQDSV